MCGLVASWCDSKNSSFQKDFSEYVLNHMSSRGPDGSNSISEWNFGFLISFNRLRLRGKDTQGRQPSYSSSKRFLGVFNGELYNIKELKKKLGHSFTKQDISEIDIILALFEKNIAEGFRSLRGMFALIIFDLEKQTLYLGRDSFGMKPLYYSNSDNYGLNVSSSAKSLALYFKFKVSEDARELFRGFGFVPEPFCWFDNVKPVPAGHLISFTKPNSQPKLIITDTIWDWLKESAMPEKGMENTIKDSVKRHLDSEFPPVLFQSGGKDSNFIAFCAQEMKKPFALGLTLSFEKNGRNYVPDESNKAFEIAKILGIRHKKIPVSRQLFKDKWQTIVKNMDQPSHDGLNVYFVSKACKVNNFRLAISGIGADELFCSYGTTQRMFKLKILNFLTLSSIIRFLLKFINNQKLIDSSLFGSFLGRYFVSRSLNPLTTKKQRQKSKALKNLYTYYEKKLEQFEISDRLALIFLETDFYMKNQLLRDADWASMANSVELRMPFVDKEVFKCVIHNQNEKITKNKDFMVKVFNKNIKKILNTPKLGFSVPFGFWLDSKLGGQKAVQRKVESDF